MVSTNQLSPVLVLTASIDPKGMQQTRRSNPKERENDYIQVLQRLVRSVSCPIVFCENSGYDLARIESELEQHGEGKSEVLQFEGQSFPRSLGKGYGEMLILRHALEHSLLIRNASHVIKLTGRYYVENLNEITNQLESNPNAIAIADFRPGARYAYSGFFIATPKFIRRYLLPRQGQLDDSRGQTMEVMMQRALEQAAHDGEEVISFEKKPRINGISGTWNVKIKEDDMHQITFSLPKLYLLTYAYGKALRRRLKDMFSYVRKK